MEQLKLKTRYQADGKAYTVGDTVLLDSEEASRLVAMGVGELIPLSFPQTPFENTPLVPENGAEGAQNDDEGDQNAPLVPLATEDASKTTAKRTTKK